jgi:hypothetical protein
MPKFLLSVGFFVAFLIMFFFEVLMAGKTRELAIAICCVAATGFFSWVTRPAFLYSRKECRDLRGILQDGHVVVQEIDAERTLFVHGHKCFDAQIVDLGNHQLLALPSNDALTRRVDNPSQEVTHTMVVATDREPSSMQIFKTYRPLAVVQRVVWSRKPRRLLNRAAKSGRSLFSRSKRRGGQEFAVAVPTSSLALPSSQLQRFLRHLCEECPVFPGTLATVEQDLRSLASRFHGI